MHEDAVSRLQGLDRISHKRWLDDEVASTKIRYNALNSCIHIQGVNGVLLKMVRDLRKDGKCCVSQ